MNTQAKNQQPKAKTLEEGLKVFGDDMAAAAEHWDALSGLGERDQGRERRAAGVKGDGVAVAAPAEVELQLSGAQRSTLRQAEVLRTMAAGLRAEVGEKVAGKSRTKAQREKLRRAEAMEADATRMVRGVEADRAALVEQRALAGAAAQTEALAQRRDEEPTTETVKTGDFARDAHGAAYRDGAGLPVFVAATVERTRIKGRDGLALQFESRRLDPDQYEAGRRYRALAELVGSDLRSQLGGEGKGGGDLDAYRLARAKAGLVRVEIERAVALELREEPVALVALRRVAGEGVTLRALAGEGGRAAMRYSAALGRALTVAVRVLKLRYPDQVWVAPGSERGGQERPLQGAPARDESTVYVDENGERLFEGVRLAKRHA